MRTGIVYMVATVLCIFVTSCFTGVESTKKITMPDTGEIAAQSPEDRFIESYFVQQGCDAWRIGKPFYYTDEKLSFVFRPEKPTFPDSISLKGKGVKVCLVPFLCFRLLIAVPTWPHEGSSGRQERYLRSRQGSYSAPLHLQG